MKLELFLLCVLLFRAGWGISIDQCPGGMPRDPYLVVYGDSCYYLDFSTLRDYEQAKFACEEKGAHLVVLERQATEVFLQRVFDEIFAVGNESHHHLYVEYNALAWIGLSSDGSGTYTWVTGEALNYTDWAYASPGHEGHILPDSGCAFLDMRDDEGSWRAETQCDSSVFAAAPQHHSICEYKDGESVPGSATTLHTVKAQTTRTSLEIPQTQTTTTISLATSTQTTSPHTATATMQTTPPQPTTTTAQTTTPEPTTTTAQTTTPQPTTTIARTTTQQTNGPSNGPSSCFTCGDIDSKTPCTRQELLPNNAVRCPVDKPYCMNDIYQVAGQEAAMYKRCVDEATCKQEWYIESSDKMYCFAYDPAVYRDDLVCHVCCYGDECNRDLVPPENTRYRP